MNWLSNLWISPPYWSIVQIYQST